MGKESHDEEEIKKEEDTTRNSVMGKDFLACLREMDKRRDLLDDSNLS